MFTGVIQPKNRLLGILLCLCLLSACGGSSSTSGDTPTLNLPDLPQAPIARLELGDDFVGFIIGSQPISPDTSSAQSQQFSQFLYEIDGDANITPVPMYDAEETLIDFTGNLSFTSVENIVPLDVMVMSPDYILLTIFHRNFDADSDNDYYNLLVDLHTGLVVSAPVGLNQQGNSGRSSLTQLGRDYFPPDNRWNDTSELYVVSVDYEALDQMEAGELQDFDYEPVDHHNGVPCPSDETDEAEETGDTSETEQSEDDAPAEEDTTTDTTDENAAADETDTDPDASDGESAEEEPVGTTCSGVTTSTPNTTETNDTTTGTTNTGSATTTEPITDAADLVGSFDEEGNPLENGQDPIINPNDDDTTSQPVEEPPIPTAVYRMSLATGNQYQLIKVSAEGDRPGLGQFIASRSGVLIYRNEDGGDNSYRVILSNCENVTGRLSTVLLAPNSTLITANDSQGTSQIYEVTYNGVNRLEFTCNGDVKRIAQTAYSTRVNSLRLPYNSPSIASYDYFPPYFVESGCNTGELFPQGAPYTDISNPMPSIPGLPSSDPRGLRKSQLFGNNLYCIGYNSGLELSVARLIPNTHPVSFDFLPFDFTNWIASFDTVHVASPTQVLFTGYTTTNIQIRTVLLDVDGTETDLSETLGGFKVGQQIEITPPPTGVYTLPEPATEAESTQ